MGLAGDSSQELNLQVEWGKLRGQIEKQTLRGPKGYDRQHWKHRRAVGNKKSSSFWQAWPYGDLEHPSQSKNLMPLENSIFKSLLNIYLEDWKKLIFYYKIFHLQNKEIITRT